MITRYFLIFVTLSVFFLCLSPSWSQHPQTQPLDMTILDVPAGKHAAWVKPVEGPLTNPFGNGYFYYGDYRGGHTGIDIKASTGAPVVAVAPGKVRHINLKNNRRYGLTVVLEHGDGLYTLYGHLSAIAVKLNQIVKQNERLGAVGTTGVAGYPHLHFEVMDRIPKGDGAWGYYYICTPPKSKNTVTFLHAKAIHIEYVIRYSKVGCHRIKRPSLTYYNPETFLPQLAVGLPALPESLHGLLGAENGFAKPAVPIQKPIQKPLHKPAKS